MKRLVAFLVLLVAAAVSATAQQRPLLTEDVDIVPEGSIEIAAGVDFFQNAKMTLSGLKGDLTRVGDVRTRTGLSKNVEFQVEGVLQNFLAINSQTPSHIPLNLDGNSTNDSGDFIVSTKIKLLNETAKRPAFGFKVGFEMPNSDQARGIGTNQINVFGKLLAQKRFGRVGSKNQARVNVFGNVGLMVMTAPLDRFTQNDLFIYGLAGIFRVSDRINIVSEVNGRVNTRSGAAPIGTESVGQFRIGTQIRASSLRFDTAAIFGLAKFSPRTGVTFGVTYLSPSIFKPAQ